MSVPAAPPNKRVRDARLMARESDRRDPQEVYSWTRYRERKTK